MVLISEIEDCLKKLLKKIADENDFTIENIEIMSDHCHMFVAAHPKYAPSTLAKLLKGISAGRLFQQFPDLKKGLWKGHLWNPSYYVGTAGSVSKEVIKRYIDGQKS
jgi:putative transposase